LRILLVETDLLENGAIRASLELARRLTQEGQDVRVAVVEPTDPSRAAPMPALAIGTPVIAADCRYGPREALDGERYGALVGVEDVDALARALSKHLSDPGELRRRAEAGRQAAARSDSLPAARAVLEALRLVAP